MNISGAGVVKSAPNKANAIKFLEFLASDEAQSTFPSATYEYPAASDVEWSPLQKSWGKFKADKEGAGKLIRIGDAPLDEKLDPIQLASWTMR